MYAKITTFAAKARAMTNNDFRLYLERRREAVAKNPEQYPDDTEEQIVTMLKIMALGGKSARRVRRDYERRLAKRGIDINAL